MASPKELLEQAKFLESIGTHGICIYDSAGTFDLDRTEDIISTFKIYVVKLVILDEAYI